VDGLGGASDGIIHYGYNFYGGQGYNRNYSTMQVEEVQVTPMITRIGILVLETTTKQPN
jgi:hypothetical protein